MQITVYHVDAFTDSLFSGNPASVCVMQEWLPDHKLHQIAKENNLPVTAFLVVDNSIYHIRWMTPEYELDLCGHGSLSASYVIFNFIDPSLNQVKLHSRSEVLPVTRNHNLITLNFPAKNLEPCSLPLLKEGLGLTPVEIYQHKNERCIAVLNTEEKMKQLKPDIQILKALGYRGFTVTALGNDVDFVSRTFYPHKSPSEDPVTGASHCVLAPYWAKKLNKTELHAKQISERGGEIFCQVNDDRVLITGKAALYMQGIINI